MNGSLTNNISNVSNSSIRNILLKQIQKQSVIKSRGLQHYPFEEHISYQHFVIISSIFLILGYELGHRITIKTMKRTDIYDDFIETNFLDERSFSELEEREKEIRKGINDVLISGLWYLLLPLTILRHLLTSSSYFESF